jgi:hypothetical protein
MPGEHRNRGSNRDPSVAKGTRLTTVQRTQILTLFTLANWLKRRISRQLSIAESTIRLTIKQGTTTPNRPLRRKPMLTTRKRKRLITRATQDAFHRRLSYLIIANIEGINAC